VVVVVVVGVHAAGVPVLIWGTGIVVVVVVVIVTTVVVVAAVAAIVAAVSLIIRNKRKFVSI